MAPLADDQILSDRQLALEYGRQLNANSGRVGLRSSSARTGPSDPTTAPSVLQSDVPSNALLSPASMNSLHHDSDSSELSELESDRDEVPQQMQTRSKTGHSKPKFLVQNTPSPGSPSNMPTEVSHSTRCYNSIVADMILVTWYRG